MTTKAKKNILKNPLKQTEESFEQITKNCVSVLAVGDIHIKHNNIPNINLFIQSLLCIIADKKPDFVILLGDILDTHEKISSICLNKAVELFEKVASIVKTFCLVGNHDMYSNQIFLEKSHWMNACKYIPNLIIVDYTYHYNYKNQDFVFVPYVYPGKFVKALDVLKDNKDNLKSPFDWKNAVCIFAHQEFQGCKMGAIESHEGDVWNDKLPPVISGHIHDNQTIPTGVYYCGSSLQHAFGESSKKVLPLITFEKGKPYHIEELELGLPKKKIIYSDVSEIEKEGFLKDIIDKRVCESKEEDKKDPDEKSSDTKNANIDSEGENLESKSLPPPVPQDEIKITLSGNYSEFKTFKKSKKYKEIIKSGVKVVFKPKKVKGEEKEKKDKDNQTMEEHGFSKILNILVMKEKNTDVYTTYEEVVNEKLVKPEDVLII
jgi:DNA repair exonuclease SbcCD nuclease subunit